MKSLLKFVQVSAVAIIVFGGVATIVCKANPEAARSIFSKEQEAQLVESLRPTVLALNDVGRHSLVGPVMSICFFVMILNFAKHVE